MHNRSPIDVKPERTQLVLVATHSRNSDFSKYQSTTEAERIIPTILDGKIYQTRVVLMNISHLVSQNLAAKTAIITTFKELNTQFNPSLVTFVIDFNCGLSGINLSIIEHFIAEISQQTPKPTTTAPKLAKALEQLSLNPPATQFTLVKTVAEVAQAEQNNLTPFRMLLVGSGGYPPSIEQANIPGYQPVENIDTFKQSYNFETTPNHLAFVRELRTPSGSTSSPSIRSRSISSKQSPAPCVSPQPGFEGRSVSTSSQTTTSTSPSSASPVTSNPCPSTDPLNLTSPSISPTYSPSLSLGVSSSRRIISQLALPEGFAYITLPSAIKEADEKNSPDTHSPIRLERPPTAETDKPKTPPRKRPNLHITPPSKSTNNLFTQKSPIKLDFPTKPESKTSVTSPKNSV